MKIAVSSADGRTISGHAGLCPEYLIIELNKDQTVRQKVIKLDKEQFLKNVKDKLSMHPEHPLFGIDAFVTQGLGENLHNMLSEDGIQVFKTNESDPLNAINGLNLTMH